MRPGYPAPLPSALDHLREILGAGPLGLFLDFDGTLSPIVADPAAARPVPGIVATLRGLAGWLPIAVVSGRELEDVRARLGVAGLWYAGGHGFEIRSPDGHVETYPVDPGVRDALARGVARLREALPDLPGVTLEEKRFSTAVHYRNAEAGTAQRAVALVADLAARGPGLRLKHGKKVVELQPDVPWHKGRALRWILDHAGSAFRGRTPMYLGDDVTDEDAFAELRASGIGVLVAREDRPTAARYRLFSPDEVSTFLRSLLAEAGSPRGGIATGTLSSPPGRASGVPPVRGAGGSLQVQRCAR